MIWSANAVVRESITTVIPSDRRYARFSSLPAVAKISAPALLATAIAASPTPPDAEWIKIRSPAESFAIPISPYCAVR